MVGHIVLAQCPFCDKAHSLWGFHYGLPMNDTSTCIRIGFIQRGCIDKLHVHSQQSDEVPSHSCDCSEAAKTTDSKGRFNVSTCDVTQEAEAERP